MRRQITHGTLGPEMMSQAQLIDTLALMVLSVTRGGDTGRIAYHLSEEMSDDGGPVYEVDGHFRSGVAGVPTTVLGIPIVREGA